MTDAPVSPGTSTAHWRDADGVSHIEVIGHVRTKGVQGICALCQQAGPLLLSHTFPAWAIRLFAGPVYHTLGKRTTIVSRQDAAKFYLLCSSCEQYLGAAENYLAVLCKGRRGELESNDVRVHPTCIALGVDPKLLLRALIGIVFKEYHSPETPYNTEVKALDEKLFDRWRERILHDSYPRHNYHLNAIKWFDIRPTTIPPRGFAEINIGKAKSHTEIVVNVSGISFFLTVHGAKPEDAELEGQDPSVFLVEQRQEWRIMASDIIHWKGAETYLASIGEKRSREDVVSSARQLWKDGFRWEDHYCPCGNLSVPFKDCCEGVWIEQSWISRSRWEDLIDWEVE